MNLHTIKSIAEELGISYIRVWRPMKCGHIPGVRPPSRNKLYLTNDEAQRIKAYFGVIEDLRQLITQSRAAR